MNITPNNVSDKIADHRSEFSATASSGESIDCPHCYSHLATVHADKFVTLQDEYISEGGDWLQSLCNRFSDIEWEEFPRNYDVSVHWGTCKSCWNTYWFIDALILPEAVPFNWWTKYLASETRDKPASFYWVRYLGAKEGVPKIWTMFTQECDRGRIDSHSFGPFKEFDDERAADLFLEFNDTLRTFAGTPVEQFGSREVYPIVPSSERSNVKLRQKSFGIFCPYCKSKLMQVDRHDSRTIQKRYWLDDGETVRNLYDALSVDEKDQENWDAEIYVGECSSCSQEYFTFEARFINAEPDDDWKQRYFFQNASRGIETNFIAEYRGKNPIVPKQWWLQCFQTPIGRFDEHIFGPYKTGYLTKRRPKENFVPGSKGPENDRAFNVLINAWKEFRELSKSEFALPVSSNQEEQRQ